MTRHPPFQSCDEAIADPLIRRALYLNPPPPDTPPEPPRYIGLVETPGAARPKDVVRGRCGVAGCEGHRLPRHRLRHARVCCCVCRNETTAADDHLVSLLDGRPGWTCEAGACREAVAGGGQAVAPPPPQPAPSATPAPATPSDEDGLPDAPPSTTPSPALAALARYADFVAAAAATDDHGAPMPLWPEAARLEGGPPMHVKQEWFVEGTKAERRG